MASLTVSNKAGDVVADGVTAQTFMDGVTAQTFMAFKRACGKGTAVVIELECGAEILVDSVALLRRLPKGAQYKALGENAAGEKLQKEHAEGCHVWEET